MSKIVKEDCKELSIYKLRELGLLKSEYRAGSLFWKSNWSDKESTVDYTLNITDRYLELSYKIRTGGEEEWTHIDHGYPILSTPCNYGGQRYWFECSVYKRGIYCGRRVAKLYLGAGSHYFACRHCYDLTYQSRIYNSSYSLAALDEAEEKIKRYYYSGKPTRAYLNYLKKEESSEKWFLRMMSKLYK